MAKDLYGPCDRVIQYMNRWNLREFGKLKIAKYDELNVIRTVTAVYRESTKRARRMYRDEAFEIYLLLMEQYGPEAKQSEAYARKVITEAWIAERLKAVDQVTQFSYDAEEERKLQRLIEALAVAASRDLVIDRALKLWSRQQGQYAINFTDEAVKQALGDAGVKKVEWVSRKDSRVCPDCQDLDGQIFDIDDVPAKHWACRCYLRPVKS